jgi:hypothetical protein
MEAESPAPIQCFPAPRNSSSGRQQQERIKLVGREGGREGGKEGGSEACGRELGLGTREGEWSQSTRRKKRPCHAAGQPGTRKRWG